MKFAILGSSSAGNSALFKTEKSTILIDAGFSGRKISQMLKDWGESVDAIDAVFLTHEHQDHCSGLRGILALNPEIKLFANRETAQAVQRQLKQKACWQVFETGSAFDFQDLEINSFSLPHDAYDPVGFLFHSGGYDLFHPRRSIAWVTDLGYTPGYLADYVRQADILIFEANHDAGLLDRDRYRPFSVKQRIKGRHGHLSNHEALRFLNTVEQPNWRSVYLAHLSKDCNDISLAKDFFESGMSCDRDYKLTIVDPENVGSFDYSWEEYES